MPNADFFVQHGFFVDQHFFDSDWCLKARSEVRSSTRAQGTVRKQGRDFLVDTSTRRAEYAKVSSAIRASTKARLHGLKPALEAHFGTELSDCEDPQFLFYGSGCFYRPHTDSSDRPDAPAFTQKRTISVIAFLNSEAEQPNEYSFGGGSVTFYGLMKDPMWEKFGFSLSGSTGLLVAFPSGMLHEVQPVTWGERYTVVSWYYSE